MWTRSELKGRAKAALKANYICCVLVAIILLFAMGSQENSTISVTKEAGSNYIKSENELRRMEFSGDGDAMYVYTEYLINSPEMVILNRFILGPMQVIWDVLMRFFGNIPFLLLALKILVFGPLEVGGCRFFIKNSNGERPALNEILFAFRSEGYWNIVFAMFMRDLSIMLWSLLFVFPGVVKALQYRMVPYLLAEDPTLLRRDAFRISREMMYGQKVRALVLDISFLLWEFVSTITFGLVGILFVNPYEYATNAELYLALGQSVEN